MVITNSQKPKILLVEDSPVSQRVVSRQLRNLGYEADIAGNGQEALALMAQTDYEIVLLDCQMPVLNGYETVQAIRKRQDCNRDVIVIAMTANTFPEEESKCLNLGMNDYLNKPFSEAELQAKLSYWSRFQSSQTAVVLAEDNAEMSAAPVPTIMAGLTPDLGVDLDRFQRVTRGNIDFQKQVLQLFLQDTQKNLALAKDAILAADFVTLEHKAHQIKGASANVGVKPIAILAEQLEQQAQQKTLNTVIDLMTDIERSLESLRTVIIN